jgi:methyl-accepting chemotaxis protein
MFSFGNANKLAIQTLESELFQLQDICRSLYSTMAVIEFQPDGVILTANDLFCRTVGYSLPELTGQHHRLFCEQSHQQSAEYARFWERLRRGESFNGEFKRVNKQKELIWLEATYFPVMDKTGKVNKVIKIASDVTAQKNAAFFSQSLISALNRSMAVIEFDLQGNVLKANDNFRAAMGFSANELNHLHHRRFCKPDYANSHDYEQFWQRLRQGQYHSGRVERVTKDGNTIWLEATYNPVLDENGKPYQVIKFATDITDRVRHAQQLQESTQIAFDIAKETELLSESGEKVIASSISTMQALSQKVQDSSTQVEQLGVQVNDITSIVNTIRQIADQTNLLALNAAIEAARAGESGRGFAVVADEVRSLASRTANSTKEIAEMINNIQSNTEKVIAAMNSSLSEADAGSQLANEAGNAINQIHAGASKVVDVVTDLNKVIAN